MGINVRWNNERNEILGELADADFQLSNLSSFFYRHTGSCVRYIDPAGDTCFNQLQLPDLLWELQQIRANVTGGRPARHLDELIGLVSQAIGTTHSYIWFLGD